MGDESIDYNQYGYIKGGAIIWKVMLGRLVGQITSTMTVEVETNSIDQVRPLALNGLDDSWRVLAFAIDRVQ